MRGRPTRVDAHLPTVDASFRTYLQWRNCPLQCIGSDHAIKWYHSLSRFGRTRCRRAVQVLPCQLCHHVFAFSDLAQNVVTICMCDEGTWFPWVINHRLRPWLRHSQTTVTFPEFLILFWSHYMHGTNFAALPITMKSRMVILWYFCGTFGFVVLSAKYHKSTTQE